jgi:hypothetical protein
VRYDLSISIDPDAPRFAGTESVELMISESVAEIACNSAELAITHARLQSGQARTGAPAAEGVTGAGLLRTEGGGSVPDSGDIRSFAAAHPLGGLQQLVDQSLELLDVRLAFVRRERARLRHVLSAPQAP